MEKGNKKSNIPKLVSGILLGGTCLCYFLIPDVQSFLNEAWNILTSDDEQKIKAWVDGFGWYGPLILIVAMIVQMFLLIIPSIALMVVSVLAYGPYWGSLISITAIFLASSVGYGIGKHLGQAFVLKLLGEKTKEKIEGLVDDYGFWAVIVTRLNPLLSNDAISFVCGLLKMKYFKFICATIVGILPLTVFIAILGKNIQSLKTGLLWGSLVSLLIFAGYIWWDKTRKSKKH